MQIARATPSIAMTGPVLNPDFDQLLDLQDDGPVFLMPSTGHVRPGAMLLSVLLHCSVGAGTLFMASLPELRNPEPPPRAPQELQFTRIIALLPPKLEAPPVAARRTPAPQQQASTKPKAPKLPGPPPVLKPQTPANLAAVANLTPDNLPAAPAPPVPVAKPKAQPLRSLPVNARKTPTATEDLLIQPDIPLVASQNARAPEMVLVNQMTNARPSFVRPPDAPRQTKAPANIAMDLEAPRLGTDPAGAMARANTPRALLTVPPAAKFPVTVPQADTPPQNIATVAGAGKDQPTIISIPSQAVPRFDQTVLPSLQSSPKASADASASAGGRGGAAGAAGTGGGNGGSETGAATNATASASSPSGPGRNPVAPAMPATTKLVRVELPRTGRYDVAIANAESGIPGASGLLKGRPVYTVYVSTGTAKDWVLQYAATAQAARPRNGTVVSLDAAAPAPLSAPYAFVLLRPPVIRFAGDGRYAFVHATINTSGKFDSLQLVGATKVEDPEELLRSLSQWEFRPATQDGVAVAVEVLLCIPNLPG